MNPKHRQRIIVAAFTFISICILLSQVPAVQIRYHQTMANYWKAQGFTPQVNSDSVLSVAIFTASGDNFANYEHHKLQLLRLGVLSYRRFTLSHPKVSPYTAKLLTELRTTAPPHVDFNGVSGPNYFYVEVWCHPSDLDEWQHTFRDDGSSFVFR